MTEPTRYQTSPVVLPLRLGDLEPVPVDGCDVCGALANERDGARDRGDMSKVSDVNIELRAHPHSTLRRPRRAARSTG